MKQLNIVTTLLIALAVAGLSAHSTAGQHHKGGHGFLHDNESLERGMSEKRIMRHLAVLDLSEEQRVEIKSVVKNGIEQSKPQRESLSIMHRKMKKLMHTEVVDEAAIKSLAAEMADVKSDLMILHINKRQQVAALLNDEQRATLKKIKHNRMMEDQE